MRTLNKFELNGKDHEEEVIYRSDFYGQVLADMGLKRYVDIPAETAKLDSMLTQIGALVTDSQSLSQTSGLALTQGSTLVRLPTNQTFTATQVSLADSTAVQITPIPENSYIVAEFFIPKH